MGKESSTGSENGFRMIHETSCIELKRQKADIKSRMFQFQKMKKRGRGGREDDNGKIIQQRRI